MFRKFAFIAALAASGSVWAQATVEEATKAGAVKMTKEDLQALHAGGVTMSGSLTNGTAYSQQNKPYGTVSGTAGGRFTLTGTWRIDDAGRYCHDVAASGGLAFNNCSVMWKLGDRYLFSSNETPSSTVRERKFTK